MKKQMIAGILAGLLLAGCSSQNTAGNTGAADNSSSSAEGETVKEIQPSSQSGSVDTGSGKTLIAWFSRVGNSSFGSSVDVITGASTNIENGTLRGNNSYLEEITERETGADEYFIQVEDPYPGNFNDTVQQFVREERDDTFHPLATTVKNMDQYDTILLIYPTWDSTLPSPVRTFLKAYDFNGRKIYPVNSNDGYGMGDSVSRIGQYAPGAQVMDSFSIDDDDMKDLDSQLTQYLKKQGLSK